MMSAESRFEEFVERVREKFGLRNRFMLKVRDEGDLITMADGDDWGMAVDGVRKECEAAVNVDGGGEMGKLEVRLTQ